MRQGISELLRDPVTGVRRPTISIGLALGLVLMTVNLTMGGRWLVWDQVIHKFHAEQRWDAAMPVADLLDRMGQRMICLPVLFAVAFVLARRRRTPRPLIFAVGGTLGLNLIVGLVKLATGRQSPRVTGPLMFNYGQDIMFPSGHTANVVFVYGLVALLVWRYGHTSRRTRLLLAAMVPTLAVLMTVISLYRQTHWLSDLVAGAMVGAMMLDLVLVADRPWPARLVGWVAPRVERPVRLVIPEWHQARPRPVPRRPVPTAPTPARPGVKPRGAPGPVTGSARPPGRHRPPAHSARRPAPVGTAPVDTAAVSSAPPGTAPHPRPAPPGTAPPGTSPGPLTAEPRHAANGPSPAPAAPAHRATPPGDHLSTSGREGDRGPGDGRVGDERVGDGRVGDGEAGDRPLSREPSLPRG